MKHSTTFMKRFLCSLLTITMLVSNISYANAGTTTYKKTDSDLTYPSIKGTSTTRLHLRVNTSLDVTTTWYALGHSVDSKGTSISNPIATSGYYLALQPSKHTIKATIFGVSPDINFSSGSKINNSGSTAEYYCDTPNWSYHIYSECNSLTGYSEIHNVGYNLRNNYGQKIDTLDCLAQIRYGY